MRVSRMGKRIVGAPGCAEAHGLWIAARGKKKKQHCFGNLLLSVTEGRRRPLIPFLGVQFL